MTVAAVARRRLHRVQIAPEDRVLFVLSALEHAAARAGRPDALKVPSHVLDTWGQALQVVWRKLDPGERALRAEYLNAYRIEANHPDHRLDAHEALAWLEG